MAALGAAFAAGSQEDGGGAEELPFNEGDRGGNPEVRAISELVIPAWLREAHGAKDVLLPVGLVPHAIQRVYPFHLVRLVGDDVGDASVPTTAHVGGAESYEARCRRHADRG